MLSSSDGCARRSSAISFTSLGRMCRSSGRGCSVIPCAPAPTQRRAHERTLGMPIARVLRSVATLLRLTESLVISNLELDLRRPAARARELPAADLVEDALDLLVGVLGGHARADRL